MVHVYISAQKTEDSLLEMSKKMELQLAIDRSSDLERQLKFAKRTFCCCSCIKPYVEKGIRPIVDRFYENLKNNQDLITIIETNSTFERLKKKLSTHVIEMFSGKLNQEFIEKRKK